MMNWDTDSGVAKTSLENGVRIVTKKMTHVRSVSMGVWVNVGARDETPADNGMSHFIEHMIFKGTAKRSAFQIAKQFDAIGGNTNAFTSFENTCYHAKVMDIHLETMVDILTDIFLNSVFDPREVDNERAVILQEIAMAEDSPDEYVHIISGRNFWGENGLGRSILGPRENILLFDAPAIKRYFRRFYQPDRIVISAAGNLEHNRLVDLVGPAFERVRPGNGLPPRITPQGCSRIDLNPRDLEQVHICLGTTGISITDPRRYAFALLNTILGGNMSSRLFQEVRERRGLAYAIYSFVTAYVDTGLFGAYVAVDPQKAVEATALILKEIGRFKNERVDATELREAQEFTKGNLLMAAESNDNQMVRLAQNETHFSRFIPLDEVVANIDAVTAEEILQLAQTLCQEDCFALTSLGPLDEPEALKSLLAH